MSKIIDISPSNLRYVDDTTLVAESEEELKSFLMKVKGESVMKLKDACSLEEKL